MKTKRGPGSIRKFPSGRYQVRHTGPNGVRRRARTTVTVESEAEFELPRIRGGGSRERNLALKRDDRLTEDSVVIR